MKIKICAEYRDMLPRPRLVCQEPDKSSRGLGSMSRHSAQILICFTGYIFQFLKSSVDGMGALQLWNELLISTIVIVIRVRLQQETIQSPSIPCWEVNQWGSTGMIILEELSWHWQNWQVWWIKSITMSRLSLHEASEGSLFWWVLLQHFTPVPSLMPAAWVQQGHSRMFWCIQIWQLSNCQTLVWKSF